MNRRGAVIAIILVVVLALTVKWWRWAMPVRLSDLREKKALIDELTEMIIPRTDTPGAKDAKVAEFVMEMVEHGISSFEQRTFIDGLKAIDIYCLNHFQREFITCTEKERMDVLTHFERDEHWMESVYLWSKIKNKLFGRPFFPLIRQLTVIGYCTSEAGCTKGLAYDYIPMQYEPCTVLEKGQKAWATA
ncbi:twin-arginine translocation pathway signal protein [Parapedobacter defluvii]|uniref:Twin-arginine translocation pathway signal protein n=1 Tax=Parapedobacter defluvii TaxID=2045106 RepID=A0ABQ1LUV6_9SPHI|nr:gluconate 2-dehydrogenase subunit 3 family protein [Parapedobacter defluvii]GGC30031.1 twin-arginine translocation pathway signal protein [Parapedobacter defluvii]